MQISTSKKSALSKAKESLINAQNIITLSTIIAIQKITGPSPRFKTIIVSFLTYFHENIVDITEESVNPEFIGKYLVNSPQKNFRITQRSSSRRRMADNASFLRETFENFESNQKH
jgi:hypothetical protein